MNDERYTSLPEAIQVRCDSLDVTASAVLAYGVANCNAKLYTWATIA
jgi:hypothetical protein